MDFVTKDKRSKIMASIRGKDTKPEIIVRRALHEMGYRFRIHKKELPGKPDICLPKYRLVIFVHGCFWHHHTKCKDGRIPESNTTFWQGKIERNMSRDKENQSALKKIGWKTAVIWECDAKNPGKLQKRIESLLPAKAANKRGRRIASK